MAHRHQLVLVGDVKRTATDSDSIAVPIMQLIFHSGERLNSWEIGFRHMDLRQFFSERFNSHRLET
jgi:hypothetical protein